MDYCVFRSNADDIVIVDVSDADGDYIWGGVAYIKPESHGNWISLKLNSKTEMPPNYWSLEFEIDKDEYAVFAATFEGYSDNELRNKWCDYCFNSLKGV